MITTVLFASAAVFSWKLLGYLLPKKLYNERTRTIADKITVALLAALVGIQGFVTSGAITFDSRIPALLIAALLLFFRAPFIVVVIVAAAVAAVLRSLGF